MILTAEMAQGLDFCFKTGALAEKGGDLLGSRQGREVAVFKRPVASGPKVRCVFRGEAPGPSGERPSGLPPAIGFGAARANDAHGGAHNQREKC